MMTAGIYGSLDLVSYLLLPCSSGHPLRAGSLCKAGPHAPAECCTLVQWGCGERFSGQDPSPVSKPHAPCLGRRSWALPERHEWMDLLMDRQMDGWVDRWIERWTDRWTGRQTNGLMDRQMDGWVSKPMDRRADRQMNGQADRWTGGWTVHSVVAVHSEMSIVILEAVRGLNPR